MVTCLMASLMDHLLASSRDQANITQSIQLTEHPIPQDMKRQKRRYSLHKHNLQQTQRGLLFTNITDIHQQTLEEQSVHLIFHVRWVRMCPNEECRIFFGGRGRPEAMRHPWLYVVRVRRGSVFRGVDFVDCGPCCCGADFAGEDDEGFELLEMEVEGW